MCISGKNNKKIFITNRNTPITIAAAKNPAKAKTNLNAPSIYLFKLFIINSISVP